jgi:exopolyphosphatase/guanosine-5'-triphosphate,3'-diphosphate pyrophosphatase
MQGDTDKTNNAPEVIAAIDLGSNSFHMIVARVEDGQLQVIDKLREMVRLGAGLTRDKYLTLEAQARALECLERFGQRVRSMPQGSVRAAGTNTLRQARNSDQFLLAAENALGHPIEIIAGREEARLVYLGVAHGLAAGEGNRLVVDIGGGSTEVIVGHEFRTLRRESLHMGCVSMSRAHFPLGHIDMRSMEKARIAARLEVSPVESIYKNLGWNMAVGSSGTIRSIRSVVTAAGWSEEGISVSSMYKLRDALLEAGHIDNLKLEGLSDERRPVFPGGFAVLLGVFEALNIESMQVSDEALREGLLYDLVGRIRHEDARERTVAAIASRYNVDTEHAQRVEDTALDFLGMVHESWDLPMQEFSAMLAWAAQLHELGIAVSHSQYQKHGAYLLANSDLSGFSRQEQSVLAALVRGHRRKLPLDVFKALPDDCERSARRLCILLRLAVLFHRSRDDRPLPPMEIKAGKSKLRITFPEGWLDEHPLTRAELENEAKFLKPAEIKLKIS